MKIGLSSVTYLGLWYDGPGLTPLEFLRRARQMGYDGVELDGRRPHGNPMDLDSGRRRSIRDTCAELELDMVALAANTDFSSLVVEHREAQLLMLREQIRLAREIGAPVVRVFLAWPGVTVQDGIGTYEVARRRLERLWRESPSLETWNATKRCLREALRYAEDDGVILALQNQSPPLRDHHDVLDMIAEIDSPRLRACIDAAPLQRQDAAGLRAVAAEAGPYQVQSHVEGAFVRREDGRVELAADRRERTPVNYPAFVLALREAGYDGYLCYEYARPAIDARHEIQGIEYVDGQAKLALEYMRDVIADAERRSVPPPVSDSGPLPVIVT